MSRAARSAARISALANARRVTALNASRRAKGESPLTKAQLRKIDTAAAKAAAKARAPKKTIKPKPTAPKRVPVPPKPVAALGAPLAPTSRVATLPRLPVATLPTKAKARVKKPPCPCKK